MVYEKVPEVMRQTERWLLYKLDDGQKMEYYSAYDKNATGIEGDWDFYLFDRAVEVAESDVEFHTCYCLNEGEYALIIDGAINLETNRVSESAREIVDTLRSYTERNMADGSLTIIFELHDADGDYCTIDPFLSKLNLGICSNGITVWGFDEVIPITGNAYKQYKGLKDCTDIIGTVMDKYLLSPADSNMNVDICGGIANDANENNEPNMDKLSWNHLKKIYLTTCENLPDSIKNRDRWLLYRYEVGDMLGYYIENNYPGNNGYASAALEIRNGISNFLLESLGTFSEATTVAGKRKVFYCGYLLDEFQYGLIIKNAINPENNSIFNWANDLIELMGSYTEAYALGSAILIIFTARSDITETFDPRYANLRISGAFIPLTGKIISPYQELNDCTDIIGDIIAKVKSSYEGNYEPAIMEITNDIDEYYKNSADESIKCIDSNNKTSLSLSHDRQITDLIIDDLVEYEGHPFKPYEGDKLDTMVKSIQTMGGVIHPIIVRSHPKQDGKFEIISGHNRARACKKAGLTTIKAIIEDLDDDAAVLVLVDTNIEQRKDLAISEIASAFKLAYNTCKRQGERKDLIGDNELLDNVVQKFKKWTTGIVGNYGDKSDRTIRRLIRLTELSTDFIADVDEGKLSPNAGEAISYLSEDEQTDLRNLLVEMNHKITVRQAKALKKSAANEEELSKERMQEILDFAKSPETTKRTPVKIPYESIAQFFDSEDLTDEDITNQIIEALTKYRSEQ